MQVGFLSKFFELALPVPGVRYPAGIDAKSDLKLLLEIATNSRLKQGQDKKMQHKQIFYCRSLGKDCFKIQVEFTNDGRYEILSDYTKMKHKNCCEKTGEWPMVIKIYNLMMLKRNLIEEFMQKENLIHDSPQTILQRISGDVGEYFYNDTVPNMEDRRKLKKRFDNIINITIKKKKQTKLSDKKTKLQQEVPNTPKLSKSKKSIKAKEPKLSKNMLKENKDPKKKNKIKLQEILHEKSNDEFYIKYEQDQQYGRPRKRVKQESNSSIYFYKCQEPDPKQNSNQPEYYQEKGESIFEEEDEDYFKRKSQINIALNKLNEAGSHNYWPESNNSIEQFANPCDRTKMDDLFASMRNSLRKSLERKSLYQIDYNISDCLHQGNENQN